VIRNGRVSTHSRPWRQMALAALGMLLLAGSPARAISIVVTYDPSVNPTETAAFNAAVGLLDGLYSNNITVRVDVNFSGSCSGTCLGQTSESLYGVTYGSWLAAMGSDAAANPSNTYLAAGYASLPASNPLSDPGHPNPSDYVAITGPNARALGLLGPSPSADATLSFNTSVSWYFGLGAPGGAQYDFVNVAEHELDEVLGIGTELNPGFPAPGIYMAEDYFRYASAGVRGSSTNPASLAYFSYNGGGTLVAPFNQGPTGDINDWGYGCGTPHPQNAFTCTGTVATYNTGSPEFAVLSTLGYDGATVPEPATWVLVLATLVFGGGLRLRRAIAG